MAATKHHNSVPVGALISIAVALALGSAPIAMLLALSSHMEALQ